MEWNAYHFVGETLRDGSQVPADGVKLRHEGPLKMCFSGLHFSRKAWQALEYAPGSTLCRVHVGGEITEPDGEDKGVCSERTIIARIDAEQLLRDFARSCARDVVHLWDAPDVVRKYLETGDETIMEAAGYAASDDAMAAGHAAWAAGHAAWAAGHAAGAAGHAAGGAGYAAGGAGYAASDDAMAATWAAAYDAQNRKQRARFTRMVNAAFDNA